MNDITFDDVIGLQDVKEALKDYFEIYFKNKQIYKDYNVRPPSGVLLSGLPGTGKTMIVRACFNSLIKGNENYVFKIMRLSDFSGSNVLGEADKKVRALFSRIRNDSKDWVLVFDEIDSICPDRGKVTSVCTLERINAILQCLDGFDGHIDNLFIIGTTNRLDKIDAAVKRSGRFDEIIDVKLPDATESVLHAKKCLCDMPFDPPSNLYETLGIFGFNSGWSGAEYTNFRARVLAEYLKNGNTTPKPEQIVKIASRIKALGRRTQPFL